MAALEEKYGYGVDIGGQQQHQLSAVWPGETMYRKDSDCRVTCMERALLQDRAS
jgi:hypothetical protein